MEDDDALVVTPKPRTALQPEEYVTIHTLLSRGYSEHEIAEIIGRSPGIVSRSRAHLRTLMQVYAPEQVENWRVANKNAADKGYYQGSKEFLESAGIIDRPQGHGGNTMTVQILNNAGQNVTLPGLPVPTINVKE